MITRIRRIPRFCGFRHRRLTVAAAVVVAVMVVGCGPREQRPAGGADSSVTAAVRPVLETLADSVAFRAMETSGSSAWSRAPFVRFDFAIERDGERTLRNRHLWSKHTGDYRMERAVRGDTTQVVLFNVWSRKGRVFVEGTELDSVTAAQVVDRAYTSFINDVYWLAMPTKLFDDGVHRGMAMDSSSSDLSMLTLSFGNVGLTPGDRYWVGVDEEGVVRKWTYILQNSDRPRTYQWREYRTIDTPSGTVRLAERKQSGSYAILTDNISLPTDVDGALFTSAAAVLD